MTKKRKTYLSILITLTAISALTIYLTVPQYFFYNPTYKDRCIQKKEWIYKIDSCDDDSELKRQIWLDSLLLEDAKIYDIHTLEEYFEKHDSLVKQSDGRDK